MTQVSSHSKLEVRNKITFFHLIDNLYLKKPWYQHLKSRWSTNFDDLEKYYLKIRIRSEEYADHTQKYEHFPISYK